MRTAIGSLAVSAALLASAAAAQGEDVPFDEGVAGVLARRCLECHGGDDPQGGLDLVRKESARRGGESGPPIVPGRPEESLLWQRIAADEMPPETPLSDAEKELLRRWIADGAGWGSDPIDPFRYSTDKRAGYDWWSLQPVRRPPVPQTDDRLFETDEPERTPVDAFVRERLVDRGLEAAPPADRIALVRRLYLDMHGLPPTPDEIEQFVRDDRADAWERLVDQVLASPRYGERWARHWLDVVRFAESNGFETNHERPNGYHFRDYVIRAFNEDKPYDRFVYEQIAGDTVGAPEATGFIVGGAVDIVKGQDPLLGLMQRQDELADMVNTTGTAFLGLTLGCAKCHNHKFDPVTQTDFYAMQAIFAGVQHGESEIPRTLSPAEQATLARAETRHTEIQQELSRLVPVAGGRTFVIDDEDARRVEILADKEGHGVNPESAERGGRQDAGGPERTPNLSGGRYTWWRPAPGRDVFAYRPEAAGSFRIWLSWGCGWSTHTQDAQYVIDRDGDLETAGDQTVMAVVDQQRFADGTGNVPGRPLWSGLRDAGVHSLGADSRIILRCGQTGTAITADAIVLEEAGEPAPQPRVRSAITSRRNEERIAPVTARALRFTIRATNNGIEPCLDELEVWTVAAGDRPAENVALASRGTVATSSGDYAGNPKHKLEHLIDGRYGNDRSWISSQQQIGWVQLEFAAPVRIDRIVWQRDREGAYTDRTPVDYTIAVSEAAPGEPADWRDVAGSQDRAPLGSPGDAAAYALPAVSRAEAGPLRQLIDESTAVDQQIADLRRKTRIYAGRFIEPGPTRRLLRGDPLTPQEEVAPASLSVLKGRLSPVALPLDAPERDRRMALAEWIIDPSHPLTPRVMVNRIWQRHFGRGLAATSSDFGAMGVRPTHPELLDWLAAEFVSSGWSLKHMHRLILHSATYRQSSRPRPKELAADAGSTLLWRFPPRRLEAEAIRDSVLAVSGRLDPRMHGPGYLLFEPNANYARNWIAKDDIDPEDCRRMIYTLKLRMENDAVFGAFDCPDAGQTAPVRSRSTTPIQSLNLFNSPFIADQSVAFAARLRTESGADARQQIERGFRLALGRPPDPEEAATAERLVASHGLPAFCRALYNANEFLFVP